MNNDTEEYMLSALAHVIEHLPVHIYWKNIEGRYLGCNTIQAKNLGFQSDANIIGKTDFELPWPDKYAVEFRANDIEVMKTGIIKTTEERSVINGKEVVVLSQKIPLKDKSGAVIGLLGISLDITDRKEAERLRIENQANQDIQLSELRKVVSYIAHDMRSPLASLNRLMEHCTEIKEYDRVTIRRATTQINDIADNLLGYFTRQSDTESSVPEESVQLPLLVAADLLEIIAEKRYEYSQLSVGFITNFSSDSHFAFICVEHQLFARSISNLINNAVETFEGSGGALAINLDIYANMVRIIIADKSNRGISDVVINKIRGATAVTNGKIDSRHDMQYNQTRDMLEQNNATLDIKFDISSGIEITLNFPQIATPDWITDIVELHSNDLVIILSDTTAYYETWRDKLESATANIRLMYFEQGIAATEFLNSLSELEKKKVVLLISRGVLKQSLCGLNVVGRARIERSILVSSHYNNPSMRELAALTKTKIMHPALVDRIQFFIDGRSL